MMNWTAITPIEPGLYWLSLPRDPLPLPAHVCFLSDVAYVERLGRSNLVAVNSLEGALWGDAIEVPSGPGRG